MKAVGGPGSDGHEKENHDQSSDPEEILVLDSEELTFTYSAYSHLLYQSLQANVMDFLLHFFPELSYVFKIGELVFEFGHVDSF